jgi:hypothetical protein
MSQDPIDSAAHGGDVSRSVLEQNYDASIRNEQSGDHSQVIETKMLMVWMRGDNIANVADFASFVDFVKRQRRRERRSGGIDVIGT